MPEISDHEMQRRLLVSQAGSAILEAMLRFSREHEELTGIEWLKAFRAAEDRILAEELRREWQEG